MRRKIDIRNTNVFCLILWCILPVIMSVCIVMMGLNGAFPALETIAESEASLGNICYNNVLALYASLFHYLGFITVLVILLIVTAAAKKRKKSTVRSHLWFLFLGLLLLWSVVCAILADDPSIAFWGEYYRNDCFASYCIYAAVFLCGAGVYREKGRKFLLQLYSAVVCFLALIMLLQEFNIDFLDYCFPSARAVVFNQFNHFGYVLCMGVMALWGLYVYDREAKGWLRGLYLFGFAFLSYSLMLNDTFGSYLAVLAALPVAYVFYFVSGRRPKNRAEWFLLFLPEVLFLVLSALDVIGLLPFTDALFGNLSQLSTDVANVAEGNEAAASAGTGRFQLWKDTVQRIKERPIFGFGPCGFTGENAIWAGTNPHNEYLQIAGFLGLPGLVLYLSALISLFVHHWKRMKQLDPMVLAVSGCTVGYLISACFGNPMFNTVPYFWMFLGLTTCTSEKEGSPFAITDETLEGLKNSGVSLKKILPAVLAAAAVFAGVILAVCHFTAVPEQDKELADLQNMQCADLTGQVLLKNGALEETAVYWYDAEGLSFLGEDEEKPAAYGEGTSSPGGGLAAFAEECDTTYDYDESADYTGKILAVTVDPAASTVTLAWVDAE